jgi:hypothetical protein
MSYPGLRNEQMRNDLIAYIQRASTAAPAAPAPPAPQPAPAASD